SFFRSRRRPARQPRPRRILLQPERLEDRTLLSGDSLAQAVPLLPAAGPGSADDSALLVRFKSAETASDVLPALPQGITAVPVGLARPGLWRGQLPSADSAVVALAAYKANASVLYAQPVQHVSIAVVPNTLVPNDASFGTQWDMNNTGQSGGVVDADIDAPE